MLALLPFASATPRFVADDRRLVSLATAAWAAATACAGREAPAARRVEIVVGPVRGGFRGASFERGPTVMRARYPDGHVVETVTDPGGIYRIALDDTSARTVAHEVAHAWVHDGPPALVEGGADLLADCIAAKNPRFPWGIRSDDLSGLADLRTWANADEAEPTERAAGYAAALRLMRAASRVVPERELWRSSWTWDAFRDRLAGTRGTALLAVLDAGVAGQRVALGDEDDDGLGAIDEALGGTDPARWDTDGDGWWDGAPASLRRPGRSGLPPSFSVACTGRAAGPLGALVRVWDGAASDSPLVWVDGEPLRIGDHAAPRAPVPLWIRPGGSIALSGRTGSASFAHLVGIGLVSDHGCVVADRWTVLGGNTRPARVRAIGEALARLDGVAAVRFGAARHRVVLHLAGPPQNQADIRVPPRLRGDDVSEDAIAAWAVAWDRIAHAPVAEEGGGDALVEAFARSFVGEADAAPWGPVSRDVGAWRDVAAACPDGWVGVLDARCIR